MDTQAVRLLRRLGYTDVRAYSPGLAGWEAAGGRVEEGAPDDAPAARSAGVPAVSRPVAARLSDRLLDRLEGIVGQTASRLLLLWLAVILVFGLVYWVPALLGAATLMHAGAAVPGTLEGLGTALYFSFITGLSVGYGDVVPIGWWRLPAILEGAADLLLFGFVISKIMSRRQDQVLDQIRATAFDERMGRVRTNLHLTLSEFEAIATSCRERLVQPEKVMARAESATLVFAGELRTIHQLLYRPHQAPEESVLEGLLATLTANLDGLRDLLDCLAAGAEPSPTMRGQLRSTTQLAEEICGDCVPHAVGPTLRIWMDRIRERARALPA